MSKYVKYIFISMILVAPKLAGATTINYGDKSWTVTPQSSVAEQSLVVRNDFDLGNITKHILFGTTITQNFPAFDAETISGIEKIADEVNQPTVDAKLKIENGWATEFVPDQTGQAVDLRKLTSALYVDQISLPLLTAEPQVRLADLNNLGIKELVAQGVSDFSGSSKSRIVNVTVGSSKYNGLIIQPGEEFAFNKYLGDIDAAHGFKPEQVIKASGIQLEFGGGLCQVSTTMFRAAMSAGMPITVRRNHSFAVHYYSPQGTDATIYPGSSDLKFINDYTTPILVRTYIDAPHVYFEMYGTKDDRKVVLDTPVQFDRKPDGSMKATWTRHVTKNGVTVDYIAKSNYVSPNLFKKVEQAATPNPDAVANSNPKPAEPTPTPTPTT